MTDTDKICRMMAEKIIDILADKQIWLRECVVDKSGKCVWQAPVCDLGQIIRNHTILPEMVELFKLQTAFMANVMHTIVSQNYDQYLPEVKALFEANKGLGAKCVNVLAKAEGRK